MRCKQCRWTYNKKDPNNKTPPSVMERGYCTLKCEVTYHYGKNAGKALDTKTTGGIAHA